METACKITKRLTVEELTFVDYLREQPFISATVRSHLIDWLLCVGTNRKIDSETLFLAVSLFDRYLSHKAVGAFEVQLVAAASLLLATRVDDLYDKDTTVNDIVDHTWRASYSAQQIDDMALDIKSTLETAKSKLVVGTAATFLNVYLSARVEESVMHKAIGQLAMYIIERALSDYYIMAVCRPDQLAAAGLFIARRTLVGHLDRWWPAALSKISGCMENDPELRATVRRLKPLFDEKLTPTAVKKKYSCAAFGEVAKIKLVF